MRRYEGGVIVGEIDPPVGTLQQWVESELDQVVQKLNANIRQNIVHNAGLVGRKGALEEVRYEMKRRECPQQ